MDHLVVVIPCINEAANIANAICSVRQEDGSSPEVVVVDGGSTDGTPVLAREAGAKVLLAPRKGRGLQMNLGWRSSQREWCLFLHGDSVLPQGYLRALQPIIEQQLQQQQQQPLLQVSELDVGDGAAVEAARLCRQQGQHQLQGQEEAPSLQTSSSKVHMTRTRRRSQQQQGPLQQQQQQQQRQQQQQELQQQPLQQQQQHHWLWPWQWSGSGARLSRESDSVRRGAGGAAATPLPLLPLASLWQRAPPAPRQWGCFRTIRTELHGTLQGSILSGGVALRTWLLGLPYGDQGIFVSRTALVQLGGFREWPLLEDLDLARRLKRTISPPAVLPLDMHTSGRRWTRDGFWRNAAFNQLILAAYTVGVHPDTLAALYYARPKR